MKIRKFREAAGLTMKELAGKVGVSVATVSRWESGVSSSFITNIESKGQVPSIEKVYMLASYLGVTINDLVGEDIITSSRGPEQPYLVRQYNRLSKEAQMEVRAFIEFKVAQETDGGKTNKEE